MIAIRYGVTLQHYVDDPARDPKTLEFIPLILAGWCRYLMGIDDEGTTFEQSPDPLLGTMKEYVAQVTLDGQDFDVHETLSPILSNQSIFGNDLYEIGLGEKVEGYFKKLISSKGGGTSNFA